MNDFLNIDCMEYMKTVPDKYFELAIVDPPYGIEIEQRVYKDAKNWDTSPPSPEYFKELFRVSKNQIIWGGNYFIENLYSTKCYLIWDKKITDKHTFSMSEFAWTSFGGNSKTYYSPPPGERGFYNIDGGARIHPTQKPIGLYRWALGLLAKAGDKILDTHVGSGSSLIACIELGFDYVGCEIDQDYFEAAQKRINKSFRKYELFEDNQ